MFIIWKGWVQEAVPLEALESILDRKLKPVTDQLQSLTESVQFISDKYDEVIKEVGSLQSKTDTVTQENKQLKAEVLSLKNNMEIQKEVINSLEQYTRRDCLEIAGVPERDDEDTNDLVIKVGQLAEIKIERNDISVSHRLPKSKSTHSTASQNQNSINSIPRMIVKFVRRDLRDKFYKGQS